MERSHSQWDLFVEHAARTDIGLRRANNQDSLAVDKAGSRQKWLERGHLYLVADGMGAHAAGELASRIATDVIPLTYRKLRDCSPPDALRAAVQDANARIYSRGQASHDFRGMGTTICALVLTAQGTIVGHVGDSRAYRWRKDRLEQLTFDHSLLWEMRAAGHIPRGESPAFVPRNIITRSLGPHPEVEVDLEGPFPIQCGDVYVLCSDGLSGPVADDEIGKIVGSMPPETAVRALVDLAILRGGSDNITGIVVRVVAEVPAAEGEPDSEGEGTGGRRPPAQPVHPVLWGVMGVLALAAMILGALGKWVTAAVSFAGTLLAAAIAIFQRLAAGRPHYRFEGQRLGHGPHKTVDCRPDGTFTAKLRETVEELRQAATYGDWTVDWSRFNRHCAQAASRAESGEYGAAVREYCRAITFMMGELKSQRGRKG